MYSWKYQNLMKTTVQVPADVLMIWCWLCKTALVELSIVSAVFYYFWLVPGQQQETQVELIQQGHTASVHQYAAEEQPGWKVLLF